jgi:ketosteroid isomerase-like protein
VVTAGDTARVINNWALTGTDAAGERVTMGARSADVVRLRQDGSWGILIDDPWGGGPVAV